MAKGKPAQRYDGPMPRPAALSGGVANGLESVGSVFGAGFVLVDDCELARVTGVVVLAGGWLATAVVGALSSADEPNALVSVGFVSDSVVGSCRVILLCCGVVVGVVIGVSLAMVVVVVVSEVASGSLAMRVPSTRLASSMELSGIGLSIDAQPASMGCRNSASALRTSPVQWWYMQTRTLSRKEPLAALHMHLGLPTPQAPLPMQLSMQVEKTTDEEVEEEVEETWLRKGRMTAVARSADRRCFGSAIFRSILISSLRIGGNRRCAGRCAPHGGTPPGGRKICVNPEWAS